MSDLVSTDLLLTESIDNPIDTFPAADSHFDRLPQARAFVILNKAISGVFIFIGRLWIAYIFISFLFFLAKNIPFFGSFLDDSNSNDLSYKVTILDSDLRINKKSFTAVPALFGPYYQSTNYAALIPLVDITNGCIPFQLKFPNISLMNIDINSEWGSAINKNLSNIHWIGIISRGGCPFDKKVYNLQKAGFSSVIIYNAFNGFDEAGDSIRMTISKEKDTILIPSMFIKRLEGILIMEALARKKQKILAIKIIPNNWQSISTDRESILDMMKQLVIFYIDLTIFACGFLLICFSLMLLKNVITKGRLDFLDALAAGGEFLLASDLPPEQPKLKNIPFPKKVLTEQDIQQMNNPDEESQEINNPCCAVCIEDFKEGDTVRELPCGHIFHAVGIDPWLLQHNRLCPVCKQDVLKHDEISENKPQNTSENLQEVNNGFIQRITRMISRR